MGNRVKFWTLDPPNYHGTRCNASLLFAVLFAFYYEYIFQFPFRWHYFQLMRSAKVVGKGQRATRGLDYVLCVMFPVQM